MVYLCGRIETWWTVFIFAALIGGAIALIVLYNMHKLPWLEKWIEKHQAKKAEKAAR